MEFLIGLSAPLPDPPGANWPWWKKWFVFDVWRGGINIHIVVFHIRIGFSHIMIEVDENGEEIK